MNTSDLLKAWRDSHGLSLEAAGATVGVTGVTWRSWEQNGDRPRPHSRAAVEIVTGISRDAWATAEELAVIEHARTARAALDAAPRAATGTEG